MNFSRLGSICSFFLTGVICLVVGSWLRAIYAPEWMAPDSIQQPAAMHPWAVEADCYSQLARVQRILHGQGLIQNHFTVENWPEGLIPSTTAPFDYAILLLYFPLCLFTSHPLDWAGALISPALWIGLSLFLLFFRSREFTYFGRALLLIGLATLPALIWATASGRPRHQSLILALMVMGISLEYERWQIDFTGKRGWHLWAGIIWGIACWTSLFEPLAVVVILILFNLVTRWKESPAFLISYGTVMLIALMLEGFHIFIPPAEYGEYLVRWLKTIAEVQPISSEEFVRQIMCLSFVSLVPFVAWRLMCRAQDRRVDLLLIILTFILTVFAFVQQRWIYYATLAELFLIVRYCQVEPRRWTRWLVMAFCVLGIFYDNMIQLQGRIRAPANQPSLELAQVSRSIDQPGGIMSPWWLSPGLLYFSGQPIVSGSSHCGISGIVASAKFYASTAPDEAEQILRARKVRWVVVWDDPAYVYPLLNSSLGILGLPEVSDEQKGDANSTMAQALIGDQYLPPSLKLRGVTTHLKLYEFVPSGD